jgi:phage/plasmid-like protein (TIGR03299 family)
VAHNIWIDGKGKEHAAFAREAAWHKLGTVVPNLMTAAETAELAGLDWNVEKRQLEWNGNPVEAYGVFRMSDNEMLGVVTDFYKPIQNAEGFKNIDALIEAIGGAHYSAAGALGKGEVVWMLAEIPYEIKIRGTEDVSKNYLLCMTRHDGKGAMIVKIVSTRVVCQNTLQVALGETGSFFKVAHFGNVEKKLDAARAVWAGVVGKLQSLEEKLNILAQRRVTKETFLAVLDNLFPPSEAEKEAASAGAKAAAKRREDKLADIAGLFKSNDNGAFPEVSGSAYNLLNAITEYVDHFSGTDASRAKSAMFGAGNDLKEEALEVILEMTATAPTNIRLVHDTKLTADGPSTGSSILDDVVTASVN